MRQWLLIALALVVGVAFGFTAAPLFERGQQQEAYPHYAEPAAQSQRSVPSLPAKPATNAVRYKTPCQEPEGGDESNLCAAWRSTNAAEKAGRASVSQTIANWLGVIGCSLR